MTDFYCECDVEAAAKSKCPQQCAMCRSLEAQAIAEDYELMLQLDTEVAL